MAKSTAVRAQGGVVLLYFWIWVSDSPVRLSETFVAKPQGDLFSFHWLAAFLNNGVTRLTKPGYRGEATFPSH